ncbi:hypothetical protein AAG674_002898 [Salmonella enterica]|nr:hypothetical protein [Salmonella enterica]ELE3268977.1 hypothetical protein [Salmonella enterica subsp. enterica serovar Muenchen]HBJ6690828.1 hypothetical protein [Salmonella enterica subsp. enterica serovar Newport]EBU3153711.1 hypothetical protein [Salmonella enterica]EBU3196904.1 hypothetical protein [Salmonella enterica]
MTDVQLLIKNDWNLTPTERLFKEKARNGISDERMAQLLQLPTHFWDVVSSKSDFNIHELPVNVQAALLGDGVDLFYVMTGEFAASDGSVKLRAFEYAISALPTDLQYELHQLVRALPTGIAY